MCGVLATISVRGECSSGCEHCHEGLGLLRHRGPHSCGSMDLDLGWCQVHLGATRLKITDQSDLAVPMGHHGVYAAYNGEIYNHRELRSRLRNGEEFKTWCDTEVLIRAWLAWGPEALHELNGMFAFVIADSRTGTVILARDRAGEKPLYWKAQPGCLAVASEAKALPGPLVECRCEDVEALEYDCLEETPWLGVRRVPPGSMIVLRRPEDLIAPPTRRWWSLRVEPQEELSVEEAAEELQPLLEDAICIRLSSEVRVACLLSGGLDSAIVQTVARAPTCYTATFAEVDNLSPAMLACAGAQLAPVSFGLEDAESVLPRVAYHLDTPATWTSICQWRLMQAMADDGFRVCLSGEGADELFLGYSRYRILWWLQQARGDERLSRYASAMDHLIGTSEGVMCRMLQRGPGLQSSARILEIVKRFDAPELSLPRRMAVIDFNSTMQVLLRMADRMAAAHSLENRSPFLDHRVIELASRLPDHVMINAGESKAVLLEVARRLGVHRTIIEEKTKRGLFLPWNSWHGLGNGQNGQSRPRGPWDRRHFHEAMLRAWREAYGHRRGRSCLSGAAGTTRVTDTT